MSILTLFSLHCPEVKMVFFVQSFYILQVSVFCESIMTLEACNLLCLQP